MAYSRSEAIEKIEAQRRAIKEHIEKFNQYPDSYDKQYAVGTITRCQENIRHIKSKCDSYIPDSYEDYWTPPYYATMKAKLITIREEILKQYEIQEDQKIIK